MKQKPIDTKILIQAKSGNKSAFRLLYNETVDGVYRLCRTICYDEATCKDMVQETYIIAFQKLDQLSHAHKLLAWLSRIAYHQCINHLKKEIQFEDITEYGEEIEEDPWYQSFSLQQILKTVEQLPESTRIVFTLYALDGHTHKEISEIVGISIGTSKSQYSYARKNLQKSLMQYNKS